jgi:hypothetical protein
MQKEPVGQLKAPFHAGRLSDPALLNSSLGLASGIFLSDPVLIALL